MCWFESSPTQWPVSSVAEQGAVNSQVEGSTPSLAFMNNCLCSGNPIGTRLLGDKEFWRMVFTVPLFAAFVVLDCISVGFWAASEIINDSLPDDLKIEARTAGCSCGCGAASVATCWASEKENASANRRSA